MKDKNKEGKAEMKGRQAADKSSEDKVTGDAKTKRKEKLKNLNKRDQKFEE